MPLNQKFSLTRINTPTGLQKISNLQNKDGNNGDDERRFWGWSRSGDCSDGATLQIDTYYVLWIGVHHETQLLQDIC